MTDKYEWQCQDFENEIEDLKKQLAERDDALVQQQDEFRDTLRAKDAEIERLKENLSVRDEQLDIQWKARRWLARYLKNQVTENETLNAFVADIKAARDNFINSNRFSRKVIDALEKLSARQPPEEK